MKSKESAEESALWEELGRNSPAFYTSSTAAADYPHHLLSFLFRLVAPFTSTPNILRNAATAHYLVPKLHMLYTPCTSAPHRKAFRHVPRLPWNIFINPVLSLRRSPGFTPDSRIIPTPMTRCRLSVPASFAGCRNRVLGDMRSMQN